MIILGISSPIIAPCVYIWCVYGIEIFACDYLHNFTIYAFLGGHGWYNFLCLKIVDDQREAFFYMKDVALA